jgi:hypothetical protein
MFVRRAFSPKRQSHVSATIALRMNFVEVQRALNGSLPPLRINILLYKYLNV